MEMKMRTALYRNFTGNLVIMRCDDYKTINEFAKDLRGERIQGA